MLLSHLFQKKYPKLDWIQVEVSSYCNASCIYCPHTVYRPNWQNRYLSMEAFTNLVPAFTTTKLVYLQGWGEPFTHPQFFEMVRLAKQAGCTVGTTSNGTLLKRDIIARLVNEGLDIIGFSLAGVDEKTTASVKAPGLKKFLSVWKKFTGPDKSMDPIHQPFILPICCYIPGLMS